VILQGGGHSRGGRVWPLHDIAITNIVWCTIYKRGVGGGGVYCAMVVQSYCNGVGFVGGVGQ